MSYPLYILSSEKEKCSGCAACAYSCPKNAITMEEDVCGYVFPNLDNELCIHCGKCFKVCPMNEIDKLVHDTAPCIVGAYVYDREALIRSASGGIATLLCEHVIASDGVAYACISNHNTVEHIRVSSLDVLEKTRGSKYVQSNISKVFSDIEKDLLNSRNVIFVGTPCQCAAIKRMYGSFDNLILVDLVCGGVPSQKMYSDFICWLETKHHTKIGDFSFRDKSQGWMKKYAAVYAEDGSVLEKRLYAKYYYYYLFTKALILRDSCYSCPYATKNRIGDLTIGDFWGAEISEIEYSDSELYNGISCVLVNSDIGMRLLKDVEDKMNIREADWNDVSEHNSCLRTPSSCDEGLRDMIKSNYEKYGNAAVIDDYRQIFGLREIVKAKLLALLPASLKIKIKRLRYRH